MKASIRRRKKPAEAKSRRPQRAYGDSMAHMPSLESLARIMVRADISLEERPLKPSPESLARILIVPDIGPDTSSGLDRKSIASSSRISLWHPLQSLKPLAASISPLMQGLRSVAPAIRVVFRKRLSAVARVALAIVMGTVAYTVYAAGHKVHRTLVPVVVSGTALIRQTPSGAHERWTNTSVTVTLDASLDALDPAAKDAVRSAFGAWVASGIGLPRLVFESSAQSRGAVQDGVNLVRYGPITQPGHEHDLAVTIGYEDATTGEILEADTIFNSDYPLAALLSPSSEKAEADDSSRGCGDRYDLENVATHEAGHFFGLGEDVEDTRATMYFRSLPCQTHKRVLTGPDRALMTTLYAEPVPSPAQGCGGSAAPTPSSTPSAPSSVK
ncbi:MAG: hypothetical protein M3O50_16510 [Myxococcota bacterium]|nr:hypothetical protein [Myxococcota bacterium]